MSWEAIAVALVVLAAVAVLLAARRASSSRRAKVAPPGTVPIRDLRPISAMRPEELALLERLFVRYDRLAESLRDGREDDARATLDAFRRGGATISPRELQRMTRDWPVREPEHAVFAFGEDRWAVLVLYVGEAPPALRFRTIRARLRGGEWFFENGYSDSRVLVAATPEERLERFRKLALTMRPEKPPAPSAGYVPPRRRPLREPRPCAGAPVLEAHRITRHGTPVPRDEVRALEEALSTRFPSCYAEIVGAFGASVHGGLVRVFAPTRIRDELDAWRERVSDYFFWPKGVDVLDAASLPECVLVGDTIRGDELVFHPNEPDRVYCLPRHQKTIDAFDGGLSEAIERLSASEGDFRYVEPIEGMVRRTGQGSATTTLQTHDQVCAALVGLGLHSHRVDTPEGDGPLTRLFMPALDGYVEVVGRFAPPIVNVAHHQKADPSVVDRVLRAVEALGYEIASEPS